MNHEGPCETLPPCDCVMRASRPSLRTAMNEDTAMRDESRNSQERERAELGLAPSELTPGDALQMRGSARIEG